VSTRPSRAPAARLAAPALAALRGPALPALALGLAMLGLALGLALLGLGACTPTVQVQAPKEPITINLNVKLDADVRLHIEDEAKKDVSSNAVF
jgi:hypothetical protein